MPFVVGIDEAGYGPLLGPLAVAATLWHVTLTGGSGSKPAASSASGADSPDEIDFWERLGGAVCRKGGRHDSRLRVDDSKQVYDRKKGLATLERPLLAFAAASGLKHATLGEWLAALGAPVVSAGTAPLPWYQDLTQSLPVDPGRSAHAAVAERLRRCMAASGVRCCGLLAQAVTEDVFNDRVDRTRNKAAVLLEQVLCLIQRAAQACGDQDVRIHVDRLGGRQDYRALLLAAFPERHLHVEQVTNECSRYRLASQRSDWTIDFTIDADQHYLPVALASMLAKYLRELLMLEFNAFWRQLLPELLPTAGYYSDAQRFLADIRPALARAELPAERFVRRR